MNQKTPGNNTHQNQNHQEDALGYSLGIHCKNSLALPDLCEGSDLDLRNFPTELPPLFIKEEGNEKTVSTLAKRPVISLFRKEEAQKVAKQVSQALADTLQGLNLDLSYELMQCRNKLINEVLETFFGRPLIPSDYPNIQIIEDQKRPDHYGLAYMSFLIGTIEPTGPEEGALGYSFKIVSDI